MNYESLITLLYNKASSNPNIQAIIDVIPEIRRYWNDRNSSLTLATLVSSSSVSYNHETATDPGFALITNRNDAMITLNNIMTFYRYESIPAGVLHIYSDISPNNFTNLFLTPAIQFPSFSNFDMIYLALSVRSFESGGYTSQPASPLGVKYLLSPATNCIIFTWYAGYTFVNINTFVNDSSISSVNVNNSGIDKFFCISCDGFNYWLGVASTINNPIFTWTKITSAANLPASALSFTSGGARSSSASQWTGTIANNFAAWSGSLPWN